MQDNNYKSIKNEMELLTCVQANSSRYINHSEEPALNIIVGNYLFVKKDFAKYLKE